MIDTPDAEDPANDGDLPQRVSSLERSLEKLGEQTRTNNDLLQRVWKLEHDLKDQEAAAKRDHEELRTRVHGPWYRDRRFWSGVVALPAMLAGGWVVDTAILEQDGAIELLHSAFGTQKAISDRLRTDHAYRAEIASALAREIDGNYNDTLVDALIALIKQDNYRRSLAETLANEIEPGERDLPKAMTAQFSDKFFPKSSFSTELDRAVGRRTRILHASVMTLGARDLDQVRYGFENEVTPDTCTYSTREELVALAGGDERLSDLVDTAACPPDLSQVSLMHQSALFVEPPGQKIDISIGFAINRLELSVLISGDSTQGAPFSPIEDYDISDLVNVTLGNNTINRLTQEGGSIDQQVGNIAYKFRVFTSKGNAVPGGDISAAFPLQALNFELMRGNEEYVVTIAVIVQRSD
jgi:hypothetical protein